MFINYATCSPYPFSLNNFFLALNEAEAKLRAHRVKNPTEFISAWKNIFSILYEIPLEKQLTYLPSDSQILDTDQLFDFAVYFQGDILHLNFSIFSLARLVKASQPKLETLSPFDFKTIWFDETMLQEKTLFVDKAQSPIFICLYPNEKGDRLVVDGNHRVCAALLNGFNIQAYQFNPGAAITSIMNYFGRAYYAFVVSCHLILNDSTYSGRAIDICSDNFLQAMISMINHYRGNFGLSSSSP